MRKRMLAMIFAALMACTLMTGCGGGTTDSVPESASNPEIIGSADTISYESIFNEYSTKMKEAFPAEEVSAKKTKELSSICNEGVEKMADLMTKNGDKYDVYQEWSEKLMDVYMNLSVGDMGEVLSENSNDAEPDVKEPTSEKTEEKQETAPAQTKQEENTESADSNVSDKKTDTEKLKELTGKSLTKAMKRIKKMGYKATYLADGVDFTEFIDSVKDDYTTGSIKVDEDSKTVEVTLALTANLEDAEAEKELAKKLEIGSAWGAAEKYGKSEFGKSFDLNYLVGKIAEYADDENTWFLKAECEVNGVDMICEAKVTGTTDDPEVVFFDVY